jgi:hypothetical protein
LRLLPFCCPEGFCRKYLTYLLLTLTDSALQWYWTVRSPGAMDASLEVSYAEDKCPVEYTIPKSKLTGPTSSQPAVDDCCKVCTLTGPTIRPWDLPESQLTEKA